MSVKKIKTVKRVNPKSIKISDEIEKRPKQGVIVIFGFAEGSKLSGERIYWGNETAHPIFLGGNFIHFLGISIATITGLYRLES